MAIFRAVSDKLAKIASELLIATVATRAEYDRPDD